MCPQYQGWSLSDVDQQFGSLVSIPGQTEHVWCVELQLSLGFTLHSSTSALTGRHANINTCALLKIDDHHQCFLTADRVCVFSLTALVRSAVMVPDVSVRDGSLGSDPRSVCRKMATRPEKGVNIFHPCLFCLKQCIPVRLLLKDAGCHGDCVKRWFL